MYTFVHVPNLRSKYRLKQVLPLTREVGEFRQWLKTRNSIRLEAVLAKEIETKCIVAWACAQHWWCGTPGRISVGVFVHPEHRRQRLGTQLMDTLLYLASQAVNKQYPVDYDETSDIAHTVEILIHKHKLRTNADDLKFFEAA